MSSDTIKPPPLPTIAEWSCACGERLRWTPGIGPGITCQCGRVYDRPQVDVGRLLERVDDLERRLRILEGLAEP